MGHEEMQSTVCRLADGMQQEACPWKKENRNFTNRCADAGCFVKKPVGVVSYGRGAVITSGTVAVSDAAFRTGSVDRNSCNLCGDSGTFRLACRKRNAGSALFMGTFDRESVFCVLAALTLIVNHGLQDVGNHFFTTLMICSGAGMLGGMLS